MALFKSRLVTRQQPQLILAVFFGFPLKHTQQGAPPTNHPCPALGLLAAGGVKGTWRISFSSTGQTFNISWQVSSSCQSRPKKREPFFARKFSRPDIACDSKLRPAGTIIAVWELRKLTRAPATSESLGRLKLIQFLLFSLGEMTGVSHQLAGQLEHGRFATPNFQPKFELSFVSAWDQNNRLP